MNFSAPVKTPPVPTPAQPALALVGCGYWGRNLARNFQALGALHTLCDMNESLLDGFDSGYEGVKKCTDVDRVLADPAIRQIAIASPASTHFSLAQAALAAGKDVFVEKPLCLEPEQGLLLAQESSRKGLILMVGHLLQYHPCIGALQALVASGELGRLFYVTSNRLHLGRIRREENALWSFAPHDISVVLSLAGHRVPDWVQCTGDCYLTPGVHDTTLTSLRFVGGFRAHIYVSWLNPFKEQKLTVVGSQGMVVFDDTQPWESKLRLHRHYLTWERGELPVPNTTRNCEYLKVEEVEPLSNECRHFLDCCATRTPPRTDAMEGVRVLRVLEAAQKSLLDEGTPTSLSAAPAHPTGGPSPYIHPSAVVDPGATLGPGSKVWHFAHVCQGAVIGERCILGQNTFVAGGARLGNNVKVQNNVAVYSGVTIEDDVFLGPSCVLTNVTNPRSQVNRQSIYERIVIRRGATVGANATLVPGVILGRYSFVAAGAVVTRSAPDYAFLVGAPARQKGWMSRHGHLLKPDPDGILRCPESGLRYQEAQPGRLHCLDLDEEAPLPESMRLGRLAYDDFKSAGPAT